jgi:hypothetical protein
MIGLRHRLTMTSFFLLLAGCGREEAAEGGRSDVLLATDAPFSDQTTDTIGTSESDADDVVGPTSQNEQVLI